MKCYRLVVGRLAEGKATPVPGSPEPLGSMPGKSKTGATRMPPTQPYKGGSPSRQYDGVVLLSSAGSKGTGFTASLFGKKFVVSNAHVFAGSRKVKGTGLNGQALKFSAVYLGRKADVALLELRDSEMVTLPLAGSVTSRASINDEVVVYGNSQGSGVVTEVRGNLLGIGPENIEVSAEFVCGNSGSPIMLRKTGEVLGVATFVRWEAPDWVTANTRFADVRRFGVRLDVLKPEDFQRLEEEVYLREVGLLEKAKDRNSLGYQMVGDLVDSAEMEPELYQDAKATAMARLWNQDWRDRTKLPPSRAKAALLHRLRMVEDYLSEPFGPAGGDQFSCCWLRNDYTQEVELHSRLMDCLHAWSRHMVEQTQ